LKIGLDVYLLNDGTHFQRNGGRIMAGFVADGVVALGFPWRPTACLDGARARVRASIAARLRPIAVNNCAVVHYYAASPVDDVKTLFDRNRAWARTMLEKDAHFFDRLVNQQVPKYLWIGCSDSRVPANEIVGLLPGDLFVHRNVSNLVVHTDLNCLSVMQYAVAVLKVQHIIVTGHYGCGGVRAAMEDKPLGLIDNWLRVVRDLYFEHEKALLAIPDESQRVDRLCEINVANQVFNACNTTIVQEAWARGQDLKVHGWIYGIRDGLLHDLKVSVSSPAEMRQLGIR
jgi:carbonic anhydrase